MAKLHLPSSEDGSTRREEQDAVGVKLWVRLAQAPSQQMSALAARSVPEFEFVHVLPCSHPFLRLPLHPSVPCTRIVMRIETVVDSEL